MAMKQFDTNALKPFYAGVDEAKLANVNLRLDHGRTTTTTQHRRRMATLDKVTAAAAQIGNLPGPGEALHCVLNGTFALFDFIPAAIQLAGAPIEELMIATLGFSARNVAALGQLIVAGDVRRLSILCSHFFAAQDAEIYSAAVELCQKHRFPIAAMRTHAKLLLMQIGDRRLVVESSANLRSCHNVEQATVFDDPGLYAFHHEWIHKLLTQGEKP